MTAKELMIRDWVIRHIGDYANPYGKINLKIKDCFDLADSAKCDPIPYTPEMLEKNGFVKVNSQRYDYGHPDTDCYVKVNPKKKMIHINGRNANINLYAHSFVHELQHALRLCGLDELADNFKV